mgnify:CR=1 FL=1
MTTSEKTDEQIAKMVQDGDLQSFGVLVDRYESKIARYAQRFLFRGDDVKDVVQDVFLKAYTNIQSFNLNRRFSPWIYRIAHNEFINAIKKRGKEPFSIFDVDTIFPHLTVSDESLDKDFDKKTVIEELNNSFKKLDTKHREILTLYYYEEMGYKEIADILEIPISTVGVRILRAKRELKKELEKK